MQHEQITGRTLHDAMSRAKALFGSDIILLETEKLRPEHPDYDIDKSTRITIGYDGPPLTGTPPASVNNRPENQSTKAANFDPLLRRQLQLSKDIKNGTDDSQSQIDRLMNEIERLHHRLATWIHPQLNPPYSFVYENLCRKGMDKIHAMEFVQNVVQTFREQSRVTQQMIENAVREKTELFSPADRVEELIKQKEQRIIAVVGTPGAGKTTSLMKLALHPVMSQLDAVGILSLDNYRIGATEPLKTFSRLTHIPVVTDTGSEDIKTILRTWNDKQVILVDTPGRSPFFPGYIKELNSTMKLIRPSDILLVVNMDSDLEDTYLSAGLYSTLNLTGLIGTKFDETRRPGKIVSLSKSLNLPVVYTTADQGIPSQEDHYKMDLFNQEG